VCEGDFTIHWTYTDCEGNTQDYVHTVTIEYDPFPAIPPTTDVVDCYANIVLPAPPVVTDNCGVTLTPTGPVETGTVVCEGDFTYTWTYTDCEGNTQDYVHTVTIEYDPFPAVPPTTDVVDCYANIVLPAPPVVTDNCGVTLTRQVLLKQVRLCAKATSRIPGHTRTAKEIHRTMFIQ
jgi:hypothetical protein